ncbi:MAG: dTDP-4-dehydrorhamnose reductase, partial [Desulfobulbaceae bacterium]|nr:dTDP-4-dehydrorhamnose reductase [Desulfobulbaceae bacterium]
MSELSIPTILIAGPNGQVGWELQRTLLPLGRIVSMDRQELNLANNDMIRLVMRQLKPDVIVNAAAYTAVDKAEEEQDLAMQVNGTAPGILAEEARRLNALLVHYSTDYIFDGAKSAPYTENDEPNPVNFYGTSKLAGERAIREIDAEHLILRTSWVYGGRGSNFLLTMLKLMKEREELRIVADQTGTPTWARLIAET